MSTLNGLKVKEALDLAVEYVYGCRVEGDIAEFGTFTGTTASWLAQTMHAIELERNDKKRLFLFDSFKGLPEPTHIYDTSAKHVKEGVWVKGSFQQLTPESLKSELAIYNISVEVIPGWFLDTVLNLRTMYVDLKFSLLHVDCDLFQSTLDCLDPLLKNKQIANGAIILFDDWNCNEASPEHGERAAWDSLVGKYRIEYSDEGPYGYAGHKFIVHDYD